MSQPTDPEANGPSDIAPRQEPYEGVKVAPGGNTSPQSAQIYNQQPQPNYVGSAGPRPVLRKTDSRTTIAPRPPGPTYTNPQQPQLIQQHPQQPQIINNPRPGPPIQHQQPVRPPQNFTGRVPLNQPPRFPPPQNQPPQRYGLYEHVPNHPGQEGNFRRAVNALTEGQIRFQRPPQQNLQGPPPRNPGLVPQKSFPAPNYQNPPPGNQQIDPNIRKSNTLENSDVLNGALREKFPVRSNNNVDQLSSTMSSEKPTPKYDDTRSSSSLGFTEKDVDTTILNGKSSSREEITERPESRTGFLSRDHSTHSSMQKIDEDDDDAVVTPNRPAYIRSGKTTPLSNSNDNLTQIKLNRADSSEMKRPPPSPGYQPTDMKKTSSSPPMYTSTPPKRDSTENLSLRNTDIESTNLQKQQFINRAPESVMKQSNLAPQEYYSRSPSPGMINRPIEQSQQQNSPKQDVLRMNSANVKNQFYPNDNIPPQMKRDDSPNLIPPNKIQGPPTPRIDSGNVSERRPPSARIRIPEGDNDSGVDESTQGNDRSFNGEQSSPRKTPSKVSNSKLPSGKCKTPVKMLQSPKSPDPSNAVPHSAEKKKVPMNKVQVGAAPSPNIKTVKSKIGSLDNASYKPGGGKIKLENRKIDFSKVQPRIAAKNDMYQPGGGDKKIPQQKLQWSAKSKIGSLENATYKPSGGDKKIETVKLDFKEKAKPKVGSKDNLKHVPGGGEVKSIEEASVKQIENRKLELKVQSKIGSLDNVKHKPGGGEVKIFDDKEYLRQKSSGEQSVRSGSQDVESIENSPTFIKKRNTNVRPPTSLNISSASPRRRVRYLDLEGPQSIVNDSPKSLDYQRPMSACSNLLRKKSKIKVSFTILDRPRWRY